MQMEVGREVAPGLRQIGLGLARSPLAYPGLHTSKVWIGLLPFRQLLERRQGRQSVLLLLVEVFESCELVREQVLGVLVVLAEHRQNRARAQQRRSSAALFAAAAIGGDWGTGGG